MSLLLSPPFPNLSKITKVFENIPRYLAFFRYFGTKNYYFRFAKRVDVFIYNEILLSDFSNTKSSRCPKLDGYAIANFGVRVEHEVV